MVWVQSEIRPFSAGPLPRALAGAPPISDAVRYKPLGLAKTLVTGAPTRGPRTPRWTRLQTSKDCEYSREHIVEFKEQ